MNRYLRQVGSFCRLALLYPQAVAGSIVNAPIPRIRYRYPGLDPNAGSPQVAVYITYDPRSLLHDYVVDQVASLAGIGYRVVVVSHSPNLTRDDVAALAPHASAIVHRRNVGHDFGGYKDGMRELGAMGDMKSLILMNDSCYGPLFGLDEIERRAEASGADIVGITDNWQPKYHLQSYFLRIGERALRAPAFRRFWRTLLPAQPRLLVIRNGEIRFTQTMIRCGLVAEALCPYHTVANHALRLILDRLSDDNARLLDLERDYLRDLANKITTGAQVNPTHHFWDVLIVDFKCPFLKRDLLRHNPQRIPGLNEWEDVLTRYTSAHIASIRQHLKLGPRPVFGLE